LFREFVPGYAAADHIQHPRTGAFVLSACSTLNFPSDHRTQTIDQQHGHRDHRRDAHKIERVSPALAAVCSRLARQPKVARTEHEDISQAIRKTSLRPPTSSSSIPGQSRKGQLISMKRHQLKR
jgi:hypothetical protein